MAAVSTRTEFTDLLNVYLPVAVAVFVVIVLALAFVVVRFRHRAGRAVSERNDAPRAELAYVLVLAAIVAVLVVITFRGESHVDALAASPALRISATGSDWRWRFDYPAQGISEPGRGQAPTDLFVPAGRTIEFDLSSLDVIHAFYIPYERFQRAAIPRIVNRFDLVFPTPGVVLSGSCNEFCGIGHTQMRFTVHVLSPAAFAAWVTERKRQESLK
jgi:cytochrome c oxidase subunit 2